MTGRNKTDARKAYNKALHAKRWAEDPAYRERRRELWRESYNRRKDDPEYKAMLSARQSAYYARRKAANGGVPPPKVSKGAHKPGKRRQCVTCGELFAGSGWRCGGCRGG